jgi:F-type H+-transporting ATPase subunit b
MSINLTLIGQIITFCVFIWFTMKYIWPPITKAMHERQKTIADGLEAGERGKRDLELAQHKATDIIRDAKLEASHVVEHANKRSVQILEEAKEHARQEGQTILKQASTEVQQLLTAAKEGLRNDVANLVVAGAEKILQQDVNPTSHEKLLTELMEGL